MADRRLIPAHELNGGQRVYVEPQHEDIPRGHKLDAMPMGGSWATVNDYIHGCAQRGSVLCYDGQPAETGKLTEPPPQERPASPAPAEKIPPDEQPTPEEDR